MALLLHEAPATIRSLTQQLQEGRLTLKVDVEHLENMDRVFDGVFNRLSSAIVMASLVIGSSIVVHANPKPHWYGTSIMGVIGFLISGVLKIVLGDKPRIGLEPESRRFLAAEPDSGFADPAVITVRVESRVFAADIAERILTVRKDQLAEPIRIEKAAALALTAEQKPIRSPYEPRALIAAQQRLIEPFGIRVDNYLPARAAGMTTA